MFFCPELLKKRRHPFFLVWIAATQKGTRLKKYLPPRKVREVKVSQVAYEILKMIMVEYPPSVPRSPTDRLPNLSLCLAAKLMHGSCVVLRQQAALLFDDLASVFTNIKQLRWSEAKGDIVKTTFKKHKKTEHVEQIIYDEYAEFELIEDDNEPLVFPNSVSDEASITLQEDIFIIPSYDDDRGFGDEAESLLPIFLEGFSAMEYDHQEQAHPDAIDLTQEQLRSEGNEEVQQGIPHQVVDEQALESHEVGAIEPETAMAYDQELGHPDVIDLPQEQLRSEGNEEVQQGIPHQVVDEQALESHEVGAIEPETAMAYDQELGHPDVIDLPQEYLRLAGDDVEPETVEAQRTLPPLETDTLPELPLTIEPGAAELGVLVHQSETRDFLDELSDIVENAPKPNQRRPTCLKRDDVIEIPTELMRNRINNGGRDTLRKESVYHDYMRTFIISKWYNTNQMTEPGLNRNLHKNLKSYFVNAFVTHPAPNIDFPAHLATVRMGSPHQPGELTDSMTASHVPRLAETSIDAVCQDSIHPESLVQLPTDPKKTPRSQFTEFPLPAELFHDISEDAGFSMQEQPDNPVLSEISTMETTVETTKDSQIKKPRKRVLPTEKTPGKRPRLSPEEIADPFTQAEQDLDNIPPQEIQTSLAHGEAEDLTLPGQQILSPPRSISPLEVSPPQSPLMTSDAVLNQLTEATLQRNEENISIHHLCRPGITRRRKAAGIFYALLELRQQNKVILQQEYVGQSPDPVLIKQNSL